MIFKILIFGLGLFLVIYGVILGINYLSKRMKKGKHQVFYLETGTPTKESYRDSSTSRSKSFYCKEGGAVDLINHPEYLHFKDLEEENEYLVLPWDRKEILPLQERKDLLVIFEFLTDDNGDIFAIPCLRRVMSIIDHPTDSPVDDYNQTFVGVLWKDGEEVKVKLIKDENILGVVKYEGIHNENKEI